MLSAMSRDEILTIKDLTIEAVTVLEWGGKTVYIRSLSAEERDDFEGSILVEKKTRNSKGRVVVNRTVSHKQVRAKLVAIAACVGPDDPGSLFAASDIPMLATKNGAALDRLYDVAARLAGISENDVDELIKKSEGTGDTDGN